MDTSTTIAAMNKVRQTRIYLDKPVPKDDLDTLLEVAQWTGSARNTQPWHFIVVQDKATLAELAALRSNIDWVANVPLVIALVFDGQDTVLESFDEGRILNGWPSAPNSSVWAPAPPGFWAMRKKPPPGNCSACPRGAPCTQWSRSATSTKTPTSSQAATTLAANPWTRSSVTRKCRRASPDRRMRWSARRGHKRSFI